MPFGDAPQLTDAQLTTLRTRFEGCAMPIAEGTHRGDSASAVGGACGSSVDSISGSLQASLDGRRGLVASRRRSDARIRAGELRGLQARSVGVEGSLAPRPGRHRPGLPIRIFAATTRRRERLVRPAAGAACAHADRRGAACLGERLCSLGRRGSVACYFGAACGREEKQRRQSRLHVVSVHCVGARAGGVPARCASFFRRRHSDRERDFTGDRERPSTLLP